MASRRKMLRLIEKANRLEMSVGRDPWTARRKRRELLEDAFAVAEQLQDTAAQGAVLRRLSTGEQLWLNWDEAIAFQEADIALAVGADDPEWEFLSRLLMAMVNLRRGPDPEAAAESVRHLQRGIALAEQWHQDVWLLVAAAFLIGASAGTSGAPAAVATFDRAVREVDLRYWREPGDERGPLAEQLTGPGDPEDKAEVVVSWTVISETYGDVIEEHDGVEYVHHHQFRQFLHLRSPQP